MPAPFSSLFRFVMWQDHPFGYVAKPETLPDGSTNVLKWNCLLPGKDGTNWEGGLFPLTLEFTAGERAGVGGPVPVLRRVALRNNLHASKQAFIVRRQHPPACASCPHRYAMRCVLTVPTSLYCCVLLLRCIAAEYPSKPPKVRFPPRLLPPKRLPTGRW